MCSLTTLHWYNHPYGVQYTCICHFINIVTLSNINVTPKLKSLLQKSWPGWPLRNIHISNKNGSFIFFLSSITAKTDRTLLCIWVTLCVYYKKQRTLYTWDNPDFLGGLMLFQFFVCCPYYMYYILCSFLWFPF